jgi:hypothetical protein
MEGDYEPVVLKGEAGQLAAQILQGLGYWKLLPRQQRQTLEQYLMQNSSLSKETRTELEKFLTNHSQESS